ncbi:hypothetical protein Tco_0876273 [Tanacetum coccineum]|uniref:Uncharacterized protein n=1 Tax=Tanacetum coccineum TaxID=301880 RepID=A0ABQ5BUL7_9ASTR
MGTCPSSLLANKAMLMLSVEAARYIIRTSPCIGAVSVGKVSTNFFISWSVAAAFCVHYIFFLSVQLLSTLKKGRDLSVPFERNRLKAANFPLRLCILRIQLPPKINIDSCHSHDILKFQNLWCIIKRDEMMAKQKGTEKPWSENRVPIVFGYICENTTALRREELNGPNCNLDIDGFCNGGELPGMVRVGSVTYFQDHKWYDELADRKLKDETLALKTKIEGSWGHATPGVLKFCKWLKSYFENFHEIENEVLTGSYANIKTEWTNNPYLDINHTLGRDYEATNTGCTQENKEHKGDPILEPSNYKVRRFEMMKYSFNDDEEYITIKESQYLNHSKDSLDAYRELLRLINEGWVVTTPEE